MKYVQIKWVQIIFFIAEAGLIAGFCIMVWKLIPNTSMRYELFAMVGFILLVALLWCIWQRIQIVKFTDELCQTMDDLIADRNLDDKGLYDDSLTAKVKRKLLQYYNVMNEERQRSQQDRQMLQTLISDISHQVKTPIAGIQMFTGILKQHELNIEKRTEFLEMMSAQINKLEFLMQSLIKMSRLETGIFTLHMEEAFISQTIAKAINTVWAKSDAKNILLSVACENDILVKHDPKWTAEAIGNILDNAIKYTQENGAVTITVRPWQFYTRIDIKDTGIGIAEKHYHEIFQRFFRAQEVSSEEGVGLGLYLANGIIVRQKGYISVQSKIGEGTTFCIYLLSS